MTTWQHTLLCAMSRNKKKMFLLYPLKWWVETLTGEIDVGGGVARCDTVALKEWSNLFWPSSVPYLNLLVNAKCSLPKRKASVSSRSVESTHRICCSFISKKKRLYCKYILFCTFVWNFFTLYTNLFDELATLYSRLYCDLDRSMYDCLWELKAVWKGWEAFDWDSLFCLNDKALTHEMNQVIDLLYI